MNMKRSTEEEERRWIDAQTMALNAWTSGDLAGAIELVGRYLAGNPPFDLRRRAIAFRGDLHEDSGDLDAAKSDFNLALDLSKEPDYERYTLELALGAVAKKLGNLEEADSWYRSALETASLDPTTSGGTALRSLLELRGGNEFSEEERQLVAKVIQQSWHLLQMEGEPNLADLQGTAWKLTLAQGRHSS